MVYISLPFSYLLFLLSSLLSPLRYSLTFFSFLSFSFSSLFFLFSLTPTICPFFLILIRKPSRRKSRNFRLYKLYTDAYVTRWMPDNCWKVTSKRCNFGWKFVSSVISFGAPCCRSMRGEARENVKFKRREGEKKESFGIPYPRGTTCNLIVLKIERFAR